MSRTPIRSRFQTNGNNATSTGMSTTTSPTPGKIGQALKFNGIHRVDLQTGYAHEVFE
jgi:hypothetical protein